MSLDIVMLLLLTVVLVLLHYSGNMQDFAVGVVMAIAVSVDRERRSRMLRPSMR